jgi:hypothetical protein
MVRQSPILIVVALVLVCAGVAAASNPLLMGPSPGLAVNGSGSAASTTAPTTATSTTGTLGVTNSVIGTTTGTLGTTPAATSGTTGTTATTTNGTTATTTNGTTTPTSPTLTPTTTGAASTTGTLAIEQIVSITRTVEPGAPVSVFTVPAGQQLVITDVIITNPGAAPACSAAVSPAGAAPNGAVTGQTPATATSESGTGVLCVPAQTSLSLGLTTGLEFAAGQSVQLANTPSSTAPEAATTGPLHYHLRGLLVSPTGV